MSTVNIVKLRTKTHVLDAEANTSDISEVTSTL